MLEKILVIFNSLYLDFGGRDFQRIWIFVRFKAYFIFLGRGHCFNKQNHERSH
jgi:hypothetical protein